jgi:glycosyltransferase involved in cell wall biosynthesis
MRVAHISIIHKPLEPRILGRQCRELAAAGYDVHLVVGGAPAEEIHGVRLHSIAREWDRPSIGRQLMRLVRAARWAFRLRASVYHLHDPHLIPLGLVLKLRGARVVYDVHEDYPAYARVKHPDHPWRGRLKALVWVVLESLARHRFDAFICASPGLARRFPATRSVVVHNFPRHRDYAAASSSRAIRPYCERRNVLIYTGYMRGIRCFWEVTKALELLPDDLDCRLRAIGAFRPPELAARARELRAWARMEVLPWQPPEVVVREQFDARVGLDLRRPLPNNDDPIRSNKLFEFMATGIPVIVSDMPLWREIVCGIGCGLVVEPGDPAAIAAAIERLLRHPNEAEAMGRRGEAAVADAFNWGRDAPRLLSLYRALEGERPLRQPPPVIEPRRTVPAVEQLKPVPAGERPTVPS